VAVLAAAVLVSLSAQAQPRGRTDGPEGSEYGKGGYADPMSSRFSLELNWGAAVAAESWRWGEGPPLFVGLTASVWGDDWYQLDFSGAYLLNSGQVNLLVGPRFRTYGFPLSFNAGLKAGAILLPEAGLRFALSPQAGVDLLLGSEERFLLGLGYALDIPIGSLALTNRLFMNVGYRF
jgi:hypothetical protein